MVESSEARVEEDNFREGNKEHFITHLRARKADYEFLRGAGTLKEKKFAMLWVHQWKFVLGVWKIMGFDDNPFMEGKPPAELLQQYD